MPAAVTTKPTYAVPNRPTRVIVTPGDGSCNFVRVWCTVAPQGTGLAKRIEGEGLNRALVYQGPPRADYPWRTSFEKGGSYTLVIQEYAKGSGWGGGYSGDPRGAPTETKLGGEQTLTLHVATKLTQRLGFGDDTATLSLFMLNDTVIKTLEAYHGEATPVITEPSSAEAATASKATAIAAAVASLVGLSSSSFLGNLGNTIDHYINRFFNHAEDGTIHDVADEQSDLNAQYIGSSSFEGMAQALTKLRRRLELHMLNARENEAANPEYVNPGSVSLHNAGGLTLDHKNTLMPVSVSANDPSSIYVGLADFFRSYEGHRPGAMHPTPDATYTLTAPTGLLLVHKEFMVSLAAASPPAAAGQSTGAAALIGAGFEES